MRVSVGYESILLRILKEFVCFHVFICKEVLKLEFNLDFGPAIGSDSCENQKDEDNADLPYFREKFWSELLQQENLSVRSYR